MNGPRQTGREDNGPPQARATRGRPQQGLAIGMVLAAVALVAILGVVFALTDRTNQGSNYNPDSDAMAAAMISQARNIRTGIDSMTAHGTPIGSITFDTATTTGLFNVATGGAEQQLLTPNYTSTSSTSTWVWKVNSSGNPVVTLYNVGITANPDYVIVAPYVNWYVCSAIDRQLHGTSTIYSLAAAATTSALTTPATAVDLSAANSGTQGWPEGCFKDANGNTEYIVTVRPQ